MLYRVQRERRVVGYVTDLAAVIGAENARRVREQHAERGGIIVHTRLRDAGAIPGDADWTIDCLDASFLEAALVAVRDRET